MGLRLSDLSFGLFQDPETPENRGFLVYLGLLGLRGSSGTARKQPESAKLGPRKSESLVREAGDFLDGSGHARTVSRVVKRTVCVPQLTMSFEVAAEQRADFDARTVRAVHQPDLPQ